jgi:hypothetical protein
MYLKLFTPNFQMSGKTMYGLVRNFPSPKKSIPKVVNDTEVRMKIIYKYKNRYEY